jgi:S1-C subfamily serine protease
MPHHLRFCRNCGFRLGEGPTEFTETERFEKGRPVNLAGNNSSSQQPFSSAFSVSGGPMIPAAGQQVAKRARKMSGMTWMFIGLLVFFIAAAAFTAIVTPLRKAVPPVASAPAVPRAYFGVTEFEDGEGGVTFDHVNPPGGPADKAGLVGGDLVTSFDGQVVRDEDEMSDLLRRTTIGKPVQVIYIRDGETITTTLTTVSRDDFNRLENDFENRPAGHGLFGYNDDDIERVPIPDTKTFGVRVDNITPNRSADLAGVKNGDIIVEFEGAAIRTTEELKYRIIRAVPYSTVKVGLLRGAQRLDILVKMGKK